MKNKPPTSVETYLQAANTRDAEALQSCFAPDAVVRDVGREIRGQAAIRAWAQHEIFAAQVSMELLSVAEREGQTVITVKVDGTFDRTGLPDPLIMEHLFTLTDGKIATLTCRLVGN